MVSISTSTTISIAILISIIIAIIIATIIAIGAGIVKFALMSLSSIARASRSDIFPQFGFFVYFALVERKCQKKIRVHRNLCFVGARRGAFFQKYS